MSTIQRKYFESFKAVLTIERTALKKGIVVDRHYEVEDDFLVAREDTDPDEIGSTGYHLNQRVRQGISHD